MSKYTPYILEKFNVERIHWGVDDGKYAVKICYRNGEGSNFTITLPRKEAKEIMTIIANIVCEGAEQVRNDILKSFGGA